MDERTKSHQMISTRIAMIVAALIIAGLFYYNLFIRGIIRYDYMVILGAAAFTKISMMIFLRIKR